MFTPMDREFGEDVFRKMERKKFSMKTGMPSSLEQRADIEEPIVPRDQ